MSEEWIERILENLGDYVWLAVGILWVLFSVLPRLFRGGPKGVETPESRHERHEQLDSAELESDGSAPPPIVPR